MKSIRLRFAWSCVKGGGFGGETLWKRLLVYLPLSLVQMGPV